MSRSFVAAIAWSRLRRNAATSRRVRAVVARAGKYMVFTAGHCIGILRIMASKFNLLDSFA